GCLSHARLSARAIQADGCALVGWVGSAVDPDFAGGPAYLELLRDALPVPCLGVLPRVASPRDPHALASSLSLAAAALSDPGGARRPDGRTGIPRPARP